jgi:hypothetical protein
MHAQHIFRPDFKYSQSTKNQLLIIWVICLY